MIWKTTINKITGLTFAKSLTLAFSAIFLFNANNAQAQVFTPDGDYTASEYAGALVKDIDLGATGTCQVKQVYSIVKSDSEGPYLLLGFYNGNPGQATFRYYLDTDPNLDLVSETFKGTSYNFPGADVVLQTNASGDGTKIFKYDESESDLVQITDSGIIAAVGDYNPSDGKFIEVKVPLSGDGSIVDICDLAEDFTIKLGSYLSFAGKSTTAKVCDFEDISLLIDANGSIAGGTAYCSTTKSTTLTLSGNYSAVKRWQKNDGSGWIDIPNTSNTYTATDVAVTTSYRAIIVNNTCPGNEVETGTATITILDSPDASISDNNGLALDCNTPSTTLTASGGTSYAWTNTNGDDLGSNASIAVSTQDTFTVTVTTDNGCTDTASVSTTLNDTKPTASIDTDIGVALDCNTPSTTLTASGGTSYAWTNTNGDDLGSNASINVSTQDTFTVTVTSDNGCTDTTSVSTTLNDTKPTASIDTDNGLALDCNTPSTTLTAAGGTSYAWTNSNGDDLGNTASINVSTQDTFTVTVTSDNGCTDTAAVSTTLDNEAPDASISDNNGLALDCNTPSTTLTAAGGVSYSWSDGSTVVGTNADLQVNSDGTFTVTVTAANGCTDTASVDVSKDASAPTASIDTDNGVALDCNTPSTTLTASGGTSYAWTNTNGDDLGNTASINVSTQDTFTVTVTSDNGCTDTAAVSTTLDNEAPDASISDNNGLALDCNTPSTTLTAAGGTSYAWTNSNGDDLGNTASINVSTQDTFTVTVTSDNGCTDTAAVSTTLDNEAPDASISNNNGLALDCNTPSTKLTAAGGTSYAWTNSNGDDLGSNASINVSTQDTFTVTVTSDNGCTDTAAVSTTLDNEAPDASISDNNGLALDCNTPSTTLTAAGGTSYAWTNTNGDDLGNTASINVSTQDTFTVTVTSDNGCTDTAAVSTTLDNEAPDASISDNNGLALDCNTPSTTLTAAGGTSYAWTNSNGDDLGNTASINVSTQDTFTVTVTSDNGCTDTAAVSTTLDNEAPDASISDNNGLALDCNTPSTTLTAAGGTSYAWTNSNGDDLGNTASINVSTQDTFTVTVTSDNGCTDTAAVSTTLDNEAPDASISNNNGLALDCDNPATTLTAAGGVSYSWSDGSTVIGTDADLQVNSDGTFTVTVTAANGCTDTASVDVSKDASAPTASIDSDNGLALDCNTPSTTLTAAGGTSYAWTNTNGDDLGNTASINVSTQDTFTVTVTSDNGCTDTAAVSTTLDNEAPDASISDNNGLALDCNTPSTTLTAAGGTSYAWTNSNGDDLGNTASINVSTQDTFTVTVTSDNGCTDTAAVSTTLDNEAPDASISNNNGLALDCDNPATTLTAAGGVSYSWSDGSTVIGTDADLQVNSDGTFTVTVTAANGCTDTASVDVSKDASAPTASIDSDNGLALDCNTPSTTLTAAGGTSYAWTNTNGDDLGNTASINVSTQDTFTVTVTSDNGCTDTAAVEVIFTPDTDNPVITECAPDVNVSADSGVCEASEVDLGIPTANDNCDTELTYENDAPLVFPVGQTIITWTVTDGSNNSVQCEQKVTVTDSEAPVVEEMEDITVNNDAGVCGAVVDFGMIGATDNCELASVEVTEGLTSGSQFPVGTTTVTYTVTDISGNTTTESFTVTVDDNEAPEISCPANITIDTETGVSYAIVDFENATATDNCEVSVEQTGGPVSGSQFEIGTTTITFTATDADGNTSECSFTVTVEDNEDPTIVCPETINQQNDPGICGAAINFTLPEIADNSGDVSLEQTSGPASGETFPVGNTTVSFTATDAAGNTSFCSFDVIVTDSEAPVAEEMDDITVNNDAGVCGAIVDFGMIGATDNCELESIEVTEGLTSGSQFPVGTTTVTYSVTDISGNTTTESFTVTVNDNEAPEISCPADITIDTETGVSYAIVDFENATATDNCEVSVEQTGGPVSGSQFEIGTTTITFTATDAAGNTSECSFTVTVEDNEDPTIVCQDDIQISNDEDICGAVVEFETPQVSDNSGEFTVSQTAGLATGETFPVGTTTVTFTVTDPAGNTSECSFDITVTDDQAPELEALENITVNNDAGICGAVVNYEAPTATDNCELAEVTLTEGLESGSEFPVGITTVTYTATDSNGNTSTSTFTVTVVDNEAPVVECPENITVTVGFGIESSIVEYSVAQTTDNCSGETITMTSGIASGEVFPVGVTTITFEATDASGNTSECSFTVTVEEESAPAPPTAPEVDVVQPSCSEPTGTITVDVQNGLTYSIDGETYQANGVFTNLSPGTYDVVAQDEFGQLSDLTTIVLAEPVAEDIVLIDNGVVDLCIDDSAFNLFNLIADNEDVGNWIDTDNTGALDNGFVTPGSLELGTYTFELQIDGNCPQSTFVTVLINDDCVVLDCSVEDVRDSISKAVTPNGDNINDFFTIDTDIACGFTYDLKIFNRWGAKVFDAKNYQNNWDGYSDSSFTSSNQLPSGTYFYVLEIREGNFEPIQGYIYLGTK